jgi:hypothetical protein
LKAAILRRPQSSATIEVSQQESFVSWLLPDQEKFAGAYRYLRVSLGGLPHLVVIEEQCLERVWDTAPLAPDDFLTCSLNQGEGIASSRIQINNVDMDVHALPVSGQSSQQCAVGMLARTFTTEKNSPPWGDRAPISLHPISGTPP